MQNESEEEARGVRVTGWERKEGQGKGSKTEPLVTLRLKAGAENQKPTEEAKNRTGWTILKKARGEGEG